MKAKSGLIQKLKLCLFFLTEPQFANILTARCDMCGSMNIIALNGETQKNGNKALYTADYICQGCGATCQSTQLWEREARP